MCDFYLCIASSVDSDLASADNHLALTRFETLSVIHYLFKDLHQKYHGQASFYPGCNFVEFKGEFDFQ